jgi:transposase
MKSKLTPQLQKEIGNNIKLGMPLKFAAEAAGISEATFYNWMERGEKESKGRYLEFLEYIKQCQSVAVQLHLKIITKAASEGSWQASAWILERRHPEEFGRRENLNIKSKNENENLNVNANFELQAPEEIEQAILNKLARIRGRRNSTAAPEEPEPEGESLS